MKNKGLFTKKIGFIILIIGFLISISLLIIGFYIKHNDVDSINIADEINNLEKEKTNIFFKEGFSKNYDLITKKIIEKSKLKNKLFDKNNYLNTNTLIYSFNFFIIILTLFLSFSIFIGAKRRKIIINKMR